MIAVPALATLAAAVGAARVVELKSDWREPCILWGITIGESSARKSPGFDLATRPLVRAQRDYFRENDAERKRRAELPEEAREAGYGRGEAPPCRRVWVDDTTLDALAPILRDNPRGLLLACEELDAWFQSFTRYSTGGATDRPRWLKLYGGRPLTVDRKGGGSISVPCAVASVAGTIQPGVLARALTADARDSGLAARFLLAFPPRRPFAWSEVTIPPGIEDDYDRLVRGLLAVAADSYPDGDPRPVPLPLSADARAMFAGFVNRIGGRIEEAHGADVRAVLGKLVGTAGRLALVCELAAASDPATVGCVGAEAMAGGIALADWFASEAERVYGLLSETGEDRGRRELVEAIRRKGGTISPRELQRHNQKRYRKADAARAELQALVGDGLGEWDEDGRFRLALPV